MGASMICVDDDIAREICDAVESAMYMRSNSPHLADFVCAFCGERPPTNHGFLPHLSNCEGMRMLKIFGRE